MSRDSTRHVPPHGILFAVQRAAPRRYHRRRVPPSYLVGTSAVRLCGSLTTRAVAAVCGALDHSALAPGSGVSNAGSLFCTPHLRADASRAARPRARGGVGCVLVAGGKPQPRWPGLLTDTCAPRP
eukprot:scaffold108_cov302-Prasinococcus_capsulatus_cf.AAC.2